VGLLARLYNMSNIIRVQAILSEVTYAGEGIGELSVQFQITVPEGQNKDYLMLVHEALRAKMLATGETVSLRIA
jgi:hypothetical protein